MFNFTLSCWLQTYAVVTSVTEPCNKFVKVAPEGEKDFEVLERGIFHWLFFDCPVYGLCQIHLSVFFPNSCTEINIV